MTADILERVAAAGIHLKVEGDKLIARPRDKLTDELRQEIRANRAEILDRLRNGWRSPQPVVVTGQPTVSLGTGAECSGCKHLLMKYEHHPETRRRFWWRCGKGYELLESRCYGSRVMLAPPDCQSFERWLPGEP